MRKVDLESGFAGFQDHWSPKIAGELNGQHVKLVKFQGTFVWHQHAGEDELFLVWKGEFDMAYRDPDGSERTQRVRAGEFIIVPRGVEHRPSAENEVEVVLFEPAGTLNTGNIRSDLTVDRPAKL